MQNPWGTYAVMIWWSEQCLDIAQKQVQTGRLEEYSQCGHNRSCRSVREIAGSRRCSRLVRGNFVELCGSIFFHVLIAFLLFIFTHLHHVLLKTTGPWLAPALLVCKLDAWHWPRYSPIWNSLAFVVSVCAQKTLSNPTSLSGPGGRSSYSCTI